MLVKLHLKKNLLSFWHFCYDRPHQTRRWTGNQGHHAPRLPHREELYVWSYQQGTGSLSSTHTITSTRSACETASRPSSGQRFSTTTGNRSVHVCFQLYSSCTFQSHNDCMGSECQHCIKSPAISSIDERRGSVDTDLVLQQVDSDGISIWSQMEMRSIWSEH